MPKLRECSILFSTRWMCTHDKALSTVSVSRLVDWERYRTFVQFGPVLQLQRIYRRIILTTISTLISNSQISMYVVSSPQSSAVPPLTVRVLDHVQANGICLSNNITDTEASTNFDIRASFKSKWTHDLQQWRQTWIHASELSPFPLVLGFPRL